MLIQPIKRNTNRQVGLVLDAHRVIGEWGEGTVNDAPNNAALYAYNHKRIFEEVRNGNGRARWWKKRYVGYEICGRKIYGMRDILAGESPQDAYDYLREWAEWVRGCGANISSLPSTAWSIWRATLPRRLVVVVNRLPMPRERLIIGGRQESKAGVYDEAISYDISGAYQYAMREMLVGRAYRHISGERWNYRPDFLSECVGFARAAVSLKRCDYGPIPVGLKNVRFPQYGRAEGVYDLQELRLAYEAGARVTVFEAWIGRGLRLPWRHWSDAISSGRSLPGLAGKMVKFMGNSLWGSFAVHGRGAWVHYEDGRHCVIHDEKDTVPPCRPLSAHISAFVRCRLYREVLDFNSAGPFVIAAHTDGVILASPAFPNGPVGNSLGEWRRRGDLENLTLVTAQAYKYTDKKSGDDRYIVAGSPPQFAPKVFRAIVESYTRRRERERVPHLLDCGRAS